MNKIKPLYCFIFLFIPVIVFCQKPTSAGEPAIKDADTRLNMGDYRGALGIYLYHYRKNDKDADLNYKVGFCYVNINDDKSKAIPYLEYVTGQQKFQPEALFYLGKAYQSALKFDQAINAYEKYIALADEKSKQITMRNIETCRSGKMLTKTPVKVTFENLGKEINSPYPDFNPLVPDDESYMVFTSRRKGNVGNFLDDDLWFTSDVYLSIVKAGKFTKAKNIGGGINTEMDEESLGLTPDGNRLLIYVDDIDIYSDIYMTTRKGKSFQQVLPLPAPVNSKSVEEGASLTPGGDTIFFASDRAGGHGGTDLYRSIRLPDKSWSMPLNLGTSINTPNNETSPVAPGGGTTLYFSSEGHNSMGGYDLFYTRWNDEDNKWDKPVNLGYPINTPDDNRFICFAGRMGFDPMSPKRYAYIATWRPGGEGDLDIYRIIFEETEAQLTTIKGKIITNITVMPSPPPAKGKNPVQTQPRQTAIPVGNAVIIATDIKTGEETGSYLSNPVTGKFILILPPSSYRLEISADGYAPLQEELNILDKGSFKSEIEKEFVLTPVQ